MQGDRGTPAWFCCATRLQGKGKEKKRKEKERKETCLEWKGAVAFDCDDDGEGSMRRAFTQPDSASRGGGQWQQGGEKTDTKERVEHALNNNSSATNSRALSTPVPKSTGFFGMRVCTPAVQVREFHKHAHA